MFDAKMCVQRYICSDTCSIRCAMMIQQQSAQRRLICSVVSVVDTVSDHC